MNDKIDDRVTVPVMGDETYEVLQSTLKWFNASALLPPEMSRVYGAVRRPVTSNMVLSAVGQIDYLSLEIVYRNGGAKAWQDSHREWCNVEWWAILPSNAALKHPETKPGRRPR